jgi:hypothetical protein
MDDARSEWFGEARGLMAREADAPSWRLLCRLADEAVTLFGAQQADEVAIPYLEPIAARWPDEERLALKTWALARSRGEPCCAWSLVRAMQVAHSADGRSIREDVFRCCVEELDPTRLEGLTWLHADSGFAANVVLWEQVPSSLMGLAMALNGHVRPLAARGWWGQLRALDVRNAFFWAGPSSEYATRGGALEQLMGESIDLGHITQLTLRGVAPGVEAMRWVLEQSALELLRLHDVTTVGDEVALLLATSPRGAWLRELVLEKLNMSPHGLWAIGASTTLRGLERVVCDNREATHWELPARAFVRGLALEGLRELAFVGCGLKADSVEALVAAAPKLPDLERLDVRHNRLSPGELRALQQTYPAARVETQGCWGDAALRGDGTTLELREGESAPPRLFYKLFKEQPAQTWTSIVIGKAGMKDLYVQPFVEGRFEALRRLELTRWWRDAPELSVKLPKMLSGEQLPALEVLELAGWPLQLKAGRSWPATLRRVALRRCELDDRDAARLIGLLPAGLERLDLRDNYLTAEAIEALIAAQPDAELIVTGNLGEQVRGATEIVIEEEQVRDRKVCEAQHRSAAWSGLERVVLRFVIDMYGDDWPDDAGLRFVGAHPHLSELATLCLDGERRGYDDMSFEDWIEAVFKGMPRGLRRLELPYALRFHPGHPLVLAQRLAHDALEVLDLRHNALNDRAVWEALAANDALPCLREVWAREGNTLEEADVARLEARGWVVR